MAIIKICRRQVKSFLSYSIILVYIVLALFFCTHINSIGRFILRTLNIKISPSITGGNVVYNIDHGAYVTRIYEPVFYGVFATHKDGMVQIDWITSGILPHNISEEIDYNRDGKIDFSVTCDTKNGRIHLNPYVPSVTGVCRSSTSEKRFILRVKIR